MRIRSTGLALFAGLSIIVAACGSGARRAVRRRQRRPRRPSVRSDASAAGGPRRRRAAPTSDLKIGVVTDVGTVNDKNFNEYTFVGAKHGAAAIGAAEPPVVVPTSRCGLRAAHPGVRRPGLRRHRGDGLQPRPGDRGARPRPTRTSGSSASTTPRASTPTGDVDPTFADCSGDIGDAAAEVHRDQLRRGSGRLPRRHRRRPRPARANIIGAIGGVSLCGAVRPLHPGLRARRQVGQPGHQRQDRLGLRQRLRPRLRRSGRGQDVRRSSSSSRTRASTSCSRSPA